MKIKKPIIAVTQGDPASISSEITAKMLTYHYKSILKSCIPVIIGDVRVFRQGIRIIKSKLRYRVIKEIPKKLEENHVYVLDIHSISPREYKFGKVNKKCGYVSGLYIKKAVGLALEKKVDAICTNAINKSAFHKGNWAFPGHTEFIANLTKSSKFAMLLSCGDLRVIHVSTHVSLVDAIKKYIKKDRILATIRLADKVCKDLGIKNPIVGVAGLNPHAGEGGAFGREEIDEIIPAIEKAKEEGINVVGPVPDDTIFSRRQMYDIIVAMYHSQGHIPLKILSFQLKDKKKNIWRIRGVNTTIGTKIIRTSVSHGTSYGKVGKGIADYHSLLDAVKLAIKFVKGKK